MEVNKSYTDDSNNATFNSATNRPMPFEFSKNGDPPLNSEKLQEIYFHDTIYTSVLSKQNASHRSPTETAREYESITKRCIKDRGVSLEKDC